MTELTRRCLSLNRQSREHLIKVLQESLEKKEAYDGKRFQTLFDIATEMFGKGILTSLRDFEIVLGRRFIAWQMREEGYSFMTIGRHLIRHHSSVMHMCKMMEDVFNYPEMFKLEMAYWDEFQNKLKEHDTNSRTNQGS